MANHQPSPDQPHNDAPFYWCAAFFLSGLTLFAIGLALGRIGRSARKAELPPEVPAGERTAQPAVTTPAAAQQAVAKGPTVVPGQAVAPGQVAVPGQPPAVATPGPAVPPVAPTAPVR
jgi:hypothetical protein